MTFGESYLAQPDLFPARLAGEPWGDRDLTLDLPGGSYQFRGLRAPHVEYLRRRYARFGTDASATPTLVCDAFRVAPEEFRALDLRAHELTFDRHFTDAGLCLAGVDVMARIQLGPPLRAAFWTSNGEPAHFHGALENVFRPLVAYRVLALGGVLLHSAGIVPCSSLAPRAVVCCGPSGAGKSTLARLAAGAGHAVASDDLNVVLPLADGTVELAPLPFAGDFETAALDPTRRPLAALCRLAQGADERLEPLPSAAAAATLVACAPYVNGDPLRGEVLLSNVERLVHSIATYRLTFALAGRAGDLLARAAR
jgi:hypothetical protein